MLRSDGFSDRFLQVSSPTIGAAALKPGYRPQNAAGVPQNAAGVPQNAAGMLLLTAVILLGPHGAGTKYTAIAIHGDEEGAKKHANMGFHDHWGKGLDQLVTLAKKMRG